MYDGESNSAPPIEKSTMLPLRNESFHGPIRREPLYCKPPSTSDGPRNVAHAHPNGSSSLSNTLFFVAFMVLSMGALYTTRDAVHAASAQVSSLAESRLQLDLKLKQAELDLNALGEELTAIDNMMEEKQSSSSSSSSADQAFSVKNIRALHEMNTLQRRVEEEVKQSEALKHKVQTASLHEIERKYGTGKLRVQMKLVFPGEPGGPDTFVLEMAPTTLMPHTVHSFLEMVSSGLLNGCSFILNAMHVIKEAPLPYDGSSAKAKAKAFADQGLESLAFREYSDDFPHKKYTVGFAADGSPSFFINTEDNSDVHMGDPCFAKVVDGFDTLRRLEHMPTRNGIWFEKRIGIELAKVLKPEDEAARSSSSSQDSPSPKLRKAQD